MFLHNVRFILFFSSGGILIILMWYISDRGEMKKKNQVCFLNRIIMGWVGCICHLDHDFGIWHFGCYFRLEKWVSCLRYFSGKERSPEA